jgi:hypothetical protein
MDKLTTFCTRHYPILLKAGGRVNVESLESSAGVQSVEIRLSQEGVSLTVEEADELIETLRRASGKSP